MMPHVSAFKTGRQDQVEIVGFASIEETVLKPKHVLFSRRTPQIRNVMFNVWYFVNALKKIMASGPECIIDSNGWCVCGSTML
jgi:hypothetical protein